MRSIPLVRAFWGQPFLRFFREIGAPVDRYLEEAKLPPDVDEASELPCPSLLLYGVIDKLAHDEGIRDVGVTVGERTRIGSWGSFGRLVAGAPTLLHAIRTARRLMPAVHTARKLNLSCNGQQARLSSKRSDPWTAGAPWEDHFILLMMIDLVKLAAGPGWRPAGVALQTNSFADRLDCAILSRAVVRRGAGATSVLFPRSFLSRRLLNAPASSSSEFQRASRSVDSTPLPTDLASSLQSVLELLVPQGHTDIDTAADLIGTSRRTLQRRLLERGHTFSSVLTRTRMDLAGRLFHRPSVKVIDVAFELGYSDPSHFTKAFRRWTGLSPRMYRGKLRTSLQAIEPPFARSVSRAPGGPRDRLAAS